MKAKTSEWSGWRIVEIDGDFTAKSVIEVRSLFDNLQRSRALKVAIDLSRTEFIDTTAIQLMINYYKKLADRQGLFKILSPTKDALEILDMLCVQELKELCISRESFERTC